MGSRDTYGDSVAQRARLARIQPKLYEPPMGLEDKVSAGVVPAIYALRSISHTRPTVLPQIPLNTYPRNLSAIDSALLVPTRSVAREFRHRPISVIQHNPPLRLTHDEPSPTDKVSIVDVS